MSVGGDSIHYPKHTASSRVHECVMFSLQEKTLNHVREAVKEEVSVAVREHGASLSDQLMNYVRSGAATPVQISPDLGHLQTLRTSVINAVRLGNINEAFQTVSIYVII